MGLRVALSTSICRSDRGKLSLGLVWFQSLKSTQTLILTSSSGTTTMLDTHCGYLTISRKLAFHCFSIYVFTLIKTFRLVLLNLCLTDLHPSTSGTLYKPGISLQDQEKIYIILEQCNQLFSFFRGDQSYYLQLSLDFSIAYVFGFKFLFSGFPSLFMLFLLIFVNPLMLFSSHSSSSTTNMCSLKFGHSFSV